MDSELNLVGEDYLSLERVLNEAYEQASSGKGKERHACSRPFEKQPMLTISELIGDNHGLIYQAIKKSQESIRMDDGAARRELLGAINYLAGAIIFLDNQQGK